MSTAIADATTLGVGPSGPAQRRVRLILRRTAAAITGLWIASLALALLVDSTVSTNARLAQVLLLVATAGWLGWYLRAIPDGYFAVLLVAIGWLQVVNSDHSGNQPLVPTTLIAPAAITIGLLGLKHSSRWVIALSAGTGLLYLWALANSAPTTDGWTDALVSVAHVPVDGMAAVAVCAVLTTVARAGDDAATQRRAQQETIASQEQTRRDRTQVTRTVHDTVINTLGVVRRGVSTDQLPTLRRRCRADLSVIASMLRDPPAGLPVESLAEAITRVGDDSAGFWALDLSARIDELPIEVPTRVTEAVCATVGEALANVAKHSGARTATLTAQRSGAGFQVEVADGGRGVAGQESSKVGTIGTLQAKYEEAYARPAGLVADVISDSHGTTVTVTWLPQPVGLLAAQENVLTSALRPAIRPIAWWVGALCFVFVGLALLGDAADTRAVVASGAVLALCVAAATIASAAARDRLPLSLWAVALLLVPLPLLAAAPGLGVESCGGGADGRWGTDAALLLLLTVTLLGPGLRWTAVGTVVYLAATLGLVVARGGDLASCLGVVSPWLAIYGAILLAFVMVRFLVTRWGDAAASDYRETERLRVLQATGQARNAVRDSYLREAIEASRPLMAELASGEADPTEPAVQHAAAVDESYLRSMLDLVDPAVGSTLAAGLVTVAVQARESGVVLRIAAPVVADPPTDLVEWTVDWLVTEIRASPGASGELTAFVLPTGGLDRAELTLVGRLSNGWRLPAQGTPPPGLEVAVEVFGDWLHATLAWNSAARLDSQSDGSM